MWGGHFGLTNGTLLIDGYYGFSMKGSGLRGVLGAVEFNFNKFSECAKFCYAPFITFYTNYGAFNTDQPKIQGFSIRLIKDSTTLTHGHFWYLVSAKLSDNHS